MRTSYDTSKAAEIIRLLQARGIGELWTLETVSQADLILGILRLDDRELLPYVTDLMGRPVTFCPPEFIPPPVPVVRKQREGDDRLVVKARDRINIVLATMLQARGAIPPGSPFLSRTGKRKVIVNTPMYARLASAKPGLSVTQLMQRGVTRRDLQIAQRRGWLQLEAEPVPFARPSPELRAVWISFRSALS